MDKERLSQIDAWLDGELSVEQIAEFEASLRANVKHMEAFVRASLLHRYIRDAAIAQYPESPIENDASNLSPPLGLTYSLLGNTWHGVVGFFSAEMPLAYLLATVITGIVLGLASLITVSICPDQEIAVQLSKSTVEHLDNTGSVPRFATKSNPNDISDLAKLAQKAIGQVTGLLDCRWSESHTVVYLGRRVAAGDEFALASGLVEITYDTGVKVLLQGPVSYQVDSPRGGFLSVGKLTARVEKKETRDQKSNPQSPIPNPALFAVRTPTAVVTDLGTEFGVEVSDTGETKSHVFRGSICVEPIVVGGHPKTNADAKVLHADETARVLRDGDRVRVAIVDASDKKFQSPNFVRDIRVGIVVKIFDLADVVAGGNGFSCRRGRGIDPATGRPTDQPWPIDGIFSVGDHKYHRVKELPLVDGVFIPDGGPGPVQVDSAGHTFEAFETTSNLSFSYVWSGVDPYKGKISRFVRSELEDIEYSSPDHSVLLMHTNKGVTFNLEAIRQANPGQRLLRFLATVGNTETNSMINASNPTTADLWILVDGNLRYHRHGINGCTGAFSVVVPIGDKDRFLTLASTDGGDGIRWDWIIFGDPHLEMTPVVESHDVPLQKLSNKN
jgi:hypothetical protein